MKRRKMNFAMLDGERAGSLINIRQIRSPLRQKKMLTPIEPPGSRSPR
jgi:hypothetical protein